MPIPHILWELLQFRGAAASGWGRASMSTAPHQLFFPECILFGMELKNGKGWNVTYKQS